MIYIINFGILYPEYFVDNRKLNPNFQNMAVEAAKKLGIKRTYDGLTLPPISANIYAYSVKDGILEKKYVITVGVTHENISKEDKIMFYIATAQINGVIQFEHYFECTELPKDFRQLAIDAASKSGKAITNNLPVSIYKLIVKDTVLEKYYVNTFYLCADDVKKKITKEEFDKEIEKILAVVPVQWRNFTHQLAFFMSKKNDFDEVIDIAKHIVIKMQNDNYRSEWLKISESFFGVK